MLTANIEIDPETGDALLTLPDEIIEKFDLHPGDDVEIKELENGCIELTFPKMAL